MSITLRALLIASALLPAIEAPAARAETSATVWAARFVCNDYGRCFETGDLERRDDYERPHDYRRPPPPDFERDARDFDRSPRDFDRRPPPPRDYDRNDPSDDDPD